MSQSQKGPFHLLQDRVDSEGIAALTQTEKRLLAITWLYLEANNGSLHQFFFNDAGKLASDALEGLEMVGASQTADILRRAIALFPRGYVPTNQLERRSVLVDLPDEIQWGRMGELTDEFFQDKEDVAQLVKDYTATHPDLLPTLHK